MTKPRRYEGLGLLSCGHVVRSQNRVSRRVCPTCGKLGKVVPAK